MFENEGIANSDIFFLVQKNNAPYTSRMDLSTLKAYLHYDPDTGIFTAKKACGKKPAGRQLGSLNGGGHLQISAFGRCYTAQRLAWFYMNGIWPNGVIDHINRIKTDNRFCNLRCVSYSHNALNTEYSRGKAKVRGVTYLPPWKATIQVDGKRKTLGRFHTLEEAVAARKAAEQAFVG